MAVWVAADANIAVEIRGVNDPLRSNVLAYLSFERYKSGAVDADTLERLNERVQREVASALRPFGYYEPKVHSEFSQNGPSDWRVVIDVDPGPPVLVDQIEVEVQGPGEHDPLFTRILDHPPLHAGERLSHAAYESLKDDLQRTAATYGYLDARLTSNELRVDLEHHTAQVALSLATGERYRFGPTTISQTVVDEALVRRYLRYREDEPFDLTQVLRTQFALDDAQYFANLEVLPGEPDRAAHRVPVSIHADASRRNRYSLGGGYATDTGPRGTFIWEDRRINSHGHRFNVEVEASQIESYALQSHYVVPIGDPAVENLTLAARVEQLQLGDVKARTQSIGPSITALGGNWQHVWFVNAMRTVSDVTAYPAASRTDRMLVPGVDLASVPKGYLGEPIFQHPFFLEVRGSNNSLGADARFVQLHVQGERVFNLYPRWHLLLRDEVGSTVVSRFEAVPAVLRFFAGGDNSVRGFAYDALSPTLNVCRLDPTGRPIPQADGKCLGQSLKVGGKDVITGTVELIRELPRNFGVATFFDYGNAFNTFGSPLAYSVGVGFRMRLPVVTLGIDVAEPLHQPCPSSSVVDLARCPHPGPRLHINFSPKL